MTNHDSAYHGLFSHPELVRDLIAHFIPEPWVAQLDLDSLERVNAKFHAEELTRREGDLIYRLRWKDSGEPVYVFFLLEFQSRPDPWMSLRLLAYTALLYQHLVREKQLTPRGLLPPVFPLVLYNGDTCWPAPLDMRELIDLPEDSPLWPYQPQIRYYIIDESRYPEGKPDVISGLLIQIDQARHPGVVAAAVSRLMGILQGEEQASLRRVFAAWIQQVAAPRLGVPLGHAVINELSEVRDMLSQRFDQWEKEFKAQGREQGLEQGLEQGREQGRAEGEALLLRRLLERRFGPLSAEVEEKLAGAPAKMLEQWGLQLLDAQTLDEVFR